MLKAGYHKVPEGHIAAVVTHLEMHKPPAKRHIPDQPDLTITRHDEVDSDWYLSLYRQIGAEYLWFSRLEMSQNSLGQTFADPAYQLYSLDKNGVALGLMELDFRIEGACELAFFGIDPALIGTGAGRFFMTQAIATAWSQPIKRFHVHTCTLDSPQALHFYIRSGFHAYKREIEISPDPRLTGVLPRSSAPKVPLIT